MAIDIGPRTPDQAARVADSWAARLRDGLAARFPNLHAEVTAGVDDAQRVRRAVHLGPQGATHYSIQVSWDASDPGRLHIECTALGTADGGPLKKPFEWLGKAVGAATILWWLYFAVFEANWGRVWSLISSLEFTRKADRGYVFSAVMGWALGPVFYLIVSLIGDWLDEKLDGRVRGRRRRFVDSEMKPWVEQFVRDLPGSPVPGREKLVFDHAAQMRPAPGYTWASEDPGSLDVRPISEPQA